MNSRERPRLVLARLADGGQGLDEIGAHGKRLIERFARPHGGAARARCRRGVFASPIACPLLVAAAIIASADRVLGVFDDAVIQAYLGDSAGHSSMTTTPLLECSMACRAAMPAARCCSHRSARRWPG